MGSDEDIVWESGLYDWEGLGGTEEGTEGTWEGILPAPGLDKALGLLRCKSAILDMFEPGEPHSQPSVAVTIATRGCLGERPLC